MDSTMWLVALAAVAAGGVVGWIVASARNGAKLQRAIAEGELARQERARAEKTLADLRMRLEEEQRLRATAETRYEEAVRAVAEMKQFVEANREQLEGSYARLSQSALRQAIDQLLEVVKPHLDGNRGEIVSSLDTKKAEIEGLLSPVRVMLEGYRDELRKSEEKRSHGYAALQEQIRGLLDATRATQMEASKLYGALKAPNVRGSWGENTLRNCVELAGMSEFCDFDVQVTFEGVDGQRMRPDMIVRLPDDRVIAVDSKAPYSAYVEAAEATDEQRRRELLALHARSIRRHIDQLSRKEYQEIISTQLGKSLDFTVLFIGGEQFLSSAMMTDPSIFEYAAGKNIVLASPTILVPLLKALASGWKAEQMEESAHRAIAIAQNLYEGFVRVFEGVHAVGKALETTVARYNAAIGSIDNLVPKARRLEEHVMSSRELQEPSPIETPVRESVKLRAQARLPIGGPEDDVDGSEEEEPEEETVEVE